jgi:septal ring factor EnvC (AmiA/AmiB activator)
MFDLSKHCFNVTVFLATVIILFCGVIDARSIDDYPVDELNKRKKIIHREIEKGKQDVEAYTRREKSIIQRLNRVDRALDASRKRLVELKREIEKLEIRIDKVLTVSKVLKKRIQINQEYIARRLVALYKLNQLGKLHLLASADTINDFIQRKVALERILAYDENVQRDLVKNKIELKEMLQSLDEHVDLKNVRLAELQKQTNLIVQEKSTRTKLLADIRKQKSLELAAIDALIQAAADLEHKIKLLNLKKTKAVPDKNALQLSFPAYKGLLIMPVKGKIVNLFGPYRNPKYNITNYRSGIDIKADHGEPIRSVFQGKVIFSEWFKGYGNMIIIDHGHSYYTVYAHLEETFKSKGDSVDTGEVIATVGDTGSMTGAKLYFEVRHHGKPMNPLKWLKKG